MHLGSLSVHQLRLTKAADAAAAVALSNRPNVSSEALHTNLPPLPFHPQNHSTRHPPLDTDAF